MLLALTFLTLLIRIPYSFTTILTCVPNSYFILNGQLCYCNSLGQANQATCQLIGRRQECYPGQIIWEECRQCICQENGNILCTNIECAEERSHKKKSLRIGSEIWCTPFRSYYFNCTLCVCPASGKISEGRCVKDSSCVLKGHHTSYDTILQHICKPKVIYLFTCLQCICSDDGIFLSSQCNETCHKRPESTKHCIPGSFYKNDCNICHCPETGIPDSNACTKLTCTKNFKLTNISAIRNSTSSCISNKFTRPKCMYCECNSQGHVNELACMEQECLKIGDYKYDSVRVTCSSGEMVPTCMECFCPRTKLTEEKYCTKVCSYQNKIAILENVLKEKIHLIDRTILKETSGTDTCESNGLFLDQGRYCLCSEEGNTEVKYCTSVVEYTTPKKPSKFRAINNLHTQQEIDGNASCEPNTYVEFGCNFCYCVKNGKIDRKWCTNDNCKIKNIIHENLKGRADSLPQNTFAGTKCVPGSVTKNNCNFCICGSSGLLADSACTKDDCDSQYTPTDELNCEPSSYYTVDCNVCLCPSDGIKNVDKCTRNQCENNFLRSQICSPGEFFSDDCNICICPSNGKKKDKICTNRTCSANDTPWKNLFRISQSLLKSRDETSVSSQNYQSCFPGEEYELGCKVCVCPDMGLKTYATCSDSLCDEQFSTTPIYEEVEEERTDHFKEDRKYNINELPIYELANRRAYNSYINEDGEMCRIYNLTESSERDDCTPGSEYIIRCRICICPYMGSIDNFCRPMPPDRYCEMAFPGYNFVPMGRRNENEKRNSNTTTAAIKIKYPIQIHLPHNHTRYRCDKPGRLKDKCYICDCKDNVIIEEHCFKSDADDCLKECGDMFTIPILLIFISIGKVTSKLGDIHPQFKSCHIGDEVQNECNRCLCTSKAIFECTPIPCRITDSSDPVDDINSLQTCSPNRLYVQNSITCICTNDGKWPHTNCYESFQSLPSENIETHKCEPNTYVMIDCNICRCDRHGEFISNRCTKNNCEDGTYRNTRRYNMMTVFKKNNLFSNCKAKHWYSFAPCQFCYCANENKLICNTSTKFNNNVTVGSYDLQQCGKDLIREALELVPSGYKSSRARINSSMELEEDDTHNNAVVDEDVVSKSDINSTRTILSLVLSSDNIDELNQTYKEEDDSDSQENEDKITITNTAAITTTAITTTSSSAETIINKDVKSTRRPEFIEYTSSDEEYDYSNEISVDMGPITTPRNVTSPSKVKYIKKGANKDKTSKQTLEHSDNTLKIKLPEMLTRVFEMALRKSMVSLTEKTKCIPGTTSTKLLKNGKLLCTTNKCK